MTIWILVFLSTVGVDFAWTKYMLEAAAKHPHWAAFWSMGIILLGAFNIVSYTQNPWLVVPAAAGAYVGTWFAVWREKGKTQCGI